MSYEHRQRAQIISITLFSSEGHDVTVHKEYYRKQPDEVELTQITQLLIANEEGKLKEFKGKKLHELDGMMLDVPQVDYGEADVTESEGEIAEPSGAGPSGAGPSGAGPSGAGQKKPNKKKTTKGKGKQKRKIESDSEDDFVIAGPSTKKPKTGKKTNDPTKIKRSNKARKTDAANPEAAESEESSQKKDMEKEAVLNHFATHIKSGKIPRKYECNSFIILNKSKLTWLQIKSKVQAAIQRSNRKK